MRNIRVKNKQKPYLICLIRGKLVRATYVSDLGDYKKVEYNGERFLVNYNQNVWKRVTRLPPDDPRY